ncbi:DUF6541 family protein [Ruania halotolerans]|uniref:DUF6541 family protein n=1 Tax=Ruania halotolerans TaxID=2897773 RepID=UPI001E5BC50F|nr:DUF6541 family protein [Ruania halotolerans]UFU07531.1 hypothetical protein LQF10_05350 [Ruania halotolerans]
MILLHALLALLVGAALLVVPGALALRLVGVRGLRLLAAAPPLTFAILGITAIVAEGMGLRWGVLAALAGTAAAIGFALGMRAFGTILTAEEPPRTSTGERAALLAGVLLSWIPVWIGTGGPDQMLQRWDALFHLGALRLITETGSASSLTLGALSYGTGQDGVYPAAWHAFTALLPTSSPTAAVLVSASLTSGATWVIGSAALARELWPGTRYAAAVAAVAAGVATATPMALWVGWGHLPNAAALAMVPGVLACALHWLVKARPPTSGARTGAVIVVLAAAGGLGLAHPNAALALAALLLAPVAWLLGCAAQNWWQTGRRGVAVGVPVGAVLLVAAATAGLLRSPLAAAVTGYTGIATDSLPVAIGEVAAGWYDLWAHPATAIAVIGAPVGAWLAWRRGAPWVAGMLAVVWVLYVDAATGGELGISGLWYSSTARLSVVVAMVTLPLGAGALLVGVQRIRRRFLERGGAHSGRPVLLLTSALAGLVVVALVVTSSVYTARRTAEVFGVDSGGAPRFVTAPEREMWEDITAEGGVLSDGSAGTVLGNPFSGTPLLYSLYGQDVVFPVAGQVLSEEQEAVLDGFAALADGVPWGDPQLCSALGALEVRYLYQDSEPYQRANDYAPLDTVEVSGAQVVAEGGTARLVELPPCR